MDSNSRSIWRHDALDVDAELNEAGDLNVRGQDLSGRLWAVYEYALTVRRDDIGTLIAALEGTVGDDVLDLLQANAETLIKTGERAGSRRTLSPPRSGAGSSLTDRPIGIRPKRDRTGCPIT